MEIRKLSRMPYAQAQVKAYDNGDLVLVSYVTDVIIVKDNWLTCTGTYSATTRKHISAFMREYFPDLTYYTAKHCYENGYSVNVETGEIKINIERASF